MMGGDHLVNSLQCLETETVEIVEVVDLRAIELRQMTDPASSTWVVGIEVSASWSLTPGKRFW